MITLTLKLNSKQDIQNFINNNPPKVYAALNENGEKITILLLSNFNMEVRTFGKNGRIKITQYDKNGDKLFEFYDGKHNIM